MLRKILCVFMMLHLIVPGFVPAGFVCAQEPQQRTYTIGILNLDAKGVSEVEAEVLSEKLRSHITQLVQSPTFAARSDKDRYDVIERQDMDRIFEQFDIQNTGCVTDSCAIEFGKMLQADRILQGTIGKVGDTYSVSARIVSVETTRTIANTDRQYRGSIDNVLNTVIPLIGDDLILGRQQKKSKKMWYIVAGVLVAGAGTGLSMMSSDKGGDAPPVLLPAPPSRP
jgi:hypothetical protein